MSSAAPSYVARLFTSPPPSLSRVCPASPLPPPLPSAAAPHPACCYLYLPTYRPLTYITAPFRPCCPVRLVIPGAIMGPQTVRRRRGAVHLALPRPRSGGTRPPALGRPRSMSRTTATRTP